MSIDSQGYCNFEAKENSIGTKIYTYQHQKNNYKFLKLHGCWHQHIHKNIKYNVWKELIIIEQHLT